MPHERYMELNDSIINAVIKSMTIDTMETTINRDDINDDDIGKNINYPTVYVATTFLHRYFQDSNFDMNQARLCFYQISRGEERVDNPGFFFDNQIFLIPWNYSNIHWVLLFIDMERKEVVVLDSNFHNQLTKDIQQQMMMTLKFMCVLSNYEHKNESNWENICVEEFEWKKENGWLPKQRNGYDCGVFMLMNIYVILKELKGFYKQRDTITFRHYLFRLLCNDMHKDEEEMKKHEEIYLKSNQGIETNNDPPNIEVNIKDTRKDETVEKQQKTDDFDEQPNMLDATIENNTALHLLAKATETVRETQTSFAKIMDTTNINKADVMDSSGKQTVLHKKLKKKLCTNRVCTTK